MISVIQIYFYTNIIYELLHKNYLKVIEFYNIEYSCSPQT